MPTVRRSRRVAADPEDVWAVVADPHHLPRWWPKVQRVEGARADGWTTVLATEKGKTVRADFRLTESSEPRLRRWEQEVDGTPFGRILSSAGTEVRLDPDAGGTRVTIELRQGLRGLARFGGFMVRRAARAQLDEALDGLERACGR